MVFVKLGLERGPGTDHNRRMSLSYIDHLEEHPPGAVLMTQGDPDNHIYLLLSGDVAIEVHGAAIGTRQAGSHVGEMALVEPAARRSATVRAINHVVAARIEEPHFSEVAAFASEAGSALVASDRELPSGTLAEPGSERSAAAVWVPARNAVFLAIAASAAEAAMAECVLAGFNREEAATFADNSAAFVAAADAYLAYGTRTGVRVVSPTLGLDKPAIVAAARLLGLGPKDVWSCYRGDAAPCGRCESCLRSVRAWAAS